MSARLSYSGRPAPGQPHLTASGVQYTQHCESFPLDITRSSNVTMKKVGGIITIYSGVPT